MTDAEAFTDSSNSLMAKVRPAAGRRFFDAATAVWMMKVFPGEFYLTKEINEVLVTVLGSCVSACIRDPVVGIGGMNHFMLPQHGSGAWGNDLKSTRFGNFAMEKLINELIKAGCVRERMEIKVFGGGNVTDSSNAVGSENAEFIMHHVGTRVACELYACFSAVAGHDQNRNCAVRIVLLAANGARQRQAAVGRKPRVADQDVDLLIGEDLQNAGAASRFQEPCCYQSREACCVSAWTCTSSDRQPGSPSRAD